MKSLAHPTCVIGKVWSKLANKFMGYSVDKLLICINLKSGYIYDLEILVEVTNQPLHCFKQYFYK